VKRKKAEEKFSPASAFLVPGVFPRGGEWQRVLFARPRGVHPFFVMRTNRFDD